VSEQRRLIELLKEKRQAVISHAVTKGLNPNAPMKPSGIQWLGDVPQHWSTTILKRLVVDRRPITYGIVQPGEPDSNGRFMIRGGDYSNGWCEADEVFRVSDAIEIPYTRSRMKTGDLIITIVGAGVGNIAVVPDWLDGANITQTSARIALNPEKANAEFVCLALQGIIGQKNLDLNVYGAAQPRLNIAHIDVYVMTVPPLEEQQEIADFIKDKVDRFGALEAEAERAIDLLQERRTALISAAVTGKIDVRGVIESAAP
jgi:type I restriction enzyme S subunit